MKNMMGDQDETQVRIATGKRFSGCETSAPSPQNSANFMNPMLWMMGGGGNPMMGNGSFGNKMGWGGLGLLGWVPMLIFWVLLILGFIALTHYLRESGKRRNTKEDTAREIVKQRYAKGEISKKEFDQIIKDIG